MTCAVCEGGTEERQILDKIFKERRYSKFERPVVNESEAITVNFSLTLQQIIDVVSCHICSITIAPVIIVSHITATSKNIHKIFFVHQGG